MTYLAKRVSGLIVCACGDDNRQEFENSIGVIL